LLVLLLSSLFWGCYGEEKRASKGSGFEEFVPQYNRYVRGWLVDEIAKAEAELKTAEEERLKATDDATRSAYDAKIADLKHRITKSEGRQALGDYFDYKAPSELPEGLVWLDGMENPEIGDPAAKKGGVWRSFVPDFPPSLRSFGPKANNSFRSEIYDDMEISLIDLHPSTGGIMPGVAKQWAYSADAKTIYFKLHEDAAYDDGSLIHAQDYQMAVYIRVSNNTVEPYWKQYLREEFAQWTVYDENTLAVTFPDSKPPLAMVSEIRGFGPAHPAFYSEYGPDFDEHYNWKVPPTTSAYQVHPEDVVKGASITLSRVDGWWAEDKKFYQYRYNPDKLVWMVIRKSEKAFELFKIGEIDYFRLAGPQSWYQDTQVDQVFDGYIEKHWWYNEFPRPNWGLSINTARPLMGDRNVRLGMAHAMNWKKVLDVAFWGDYSRLPGYVDGYGDLVNPEVQPREFSVTKARDYFAKAGFTEEGQDGVLKKPDGTRLEFALSFPTSSPLIVKIMAILKEEARSSGMDVILDGGEHQIIYKREMEKKHDVAFSAWSVQPPFFQFFDYFHSSNAYDEKGNLKLETNNVFTYKNDRMDFLCESYRGARTRAAKKELGMEMQQIIHDEALFIPGWRVDFERIGCWRWVRWPDVPETRFCPPIVSRPYQSYGFWIDDEMKKDTLEARREGRTFPEVERVIDVFQEPMKGVSE